MITHHSPIHCSQCKRDEQFRTRKVGADLMRNVSHYTIYKGAIDMLHFSILSIAHLRKIPVFAAHCLAWETQPPHFSLETRTLTELEVKQYWQNECSWAKYKWIVTVYTIGKQEMCILHSKADITLKVASSWASFF